MVKRLTCDEFITKAVNIHGKKYDYSKVEYTNGDTKIIIICNNHGSFKQTPHGHLTGRGCQKCGGRATYNTEEFIIKAKKIHGDKYDYSKVEYKSSRNKINIKCLNGHGIFKQTAHSHLKGHGCPGCIQNTHSNSQIKWLNFLEKFNNIKIQNALNGGEYLIKGTRWKADGYCKETNTIFEFHGSFWHGSPELYNADMIHPKVQKTMGELYKKTLKREDTIKELGYNLVVMWEYKWKKINNSIKRIQKLFKFCNSEFCRDLNASRNILIKNEHLF